MNAGPETMAEARKADRISSRTAALQLAVEARNNAEREIEFYVRGLRRDGVSWGVIARQLGTSRQAAHKRFSN